VCSKSHVLIIPTAALDSACTLGVRATAACARASTPMIDAIAKTAPQGDRCGAKIAPYPIPSLKSFYKLARNRVVGLYGQTELSVKDEKL
jgi:hypothetical protein